MTTAVDLLSDPALGLVREVREPQLRMAASVEDAISNGGVYICEGPVGLGKSLAYLTPALMAQGRRTIIATAKKGLQDQIIQKDLPSIVITLKKILGDKEFAAINKDPETGNPRNVGVALKGKGNYACKLLASKQDLDRTYSDWLATKTKYGDRADYPGAPPKWWPSATAEDCIGRGCAHHASCKYTQLKQDVAISQVAVINHHLLGSDMYFGHGKLTGGPFDILIIDEAHKVSEGIRAAFTLKISEASITDLILVLSKTSFKFPSVGTLATDWSDMFRAIPNHHWRDPHLREVPVFPGGTEDSVNGLIALGAEVKKILGLYKITGDPSDPTFWERMNTALEGVPDSVRAELASLCMIQRRLDNLNRALELMQGQVAPDDSITDPEEAEERRIRIIANTVIYGNADQRGRFHISAAPVNLGGIAYGYLSKIKTVIVTSATLAVNNGFSHLSDVIGVKPTKEEILPSSFDYSTQGFLYVPRDIQHMSRKAPEYQEAMDKRIDRCVDLVKMSQGGAFILTTANDELDQVAHALMKNTKFPVFVQGHSKNPWHGDPQTVLQQFLKAKNGVLVGSKSFWEGVDVAGERLRLVVIMKLPFPVPTDPLVMARKWKYEGIAGFKNVDLVDMIIDLRQGAGRLIRSKDDRGIVAILDSRLWGKPYAREVKAALGFPVTDDLELCRKFLPLFLAHFRKVSPNAPIAV